MSVCLFIVNIKYIQFYCSHFYVLHSFRVLIVCVRVCVLVSQAQEVEQRHKKRAQELDGDVLIDAASEARIVEQTMCFPIIHLPAMQQ